eukprot:TRINITY_DN17787_c0_g1_i1.p1 TRINITY_DN17787_c0_g1~~TRINITY_DN17787_c0_g1_i1.p1  ORF type:complete len:195 (-),score=25.70 TRINITY_DN17787_c0_g1_i1:127-711(-)
MKQRPRKQCPEEWLMSYQHFKAQGWHRYLRGGSILDLGCGDSKFMSDAYDDGADDITCCDIEPSVLETMRQRNISRPGIKYKRVDARKMPAFADKSFDVVFDKSTMDALKCSGSAATRSCSAEVYRVLKDTGWYFCISVHSSDYFLATLQETGSFGYKWHTEFREFVNESYDANSHTHQYLYMYVSRKVPFQLK